MSSEFGANTTGQEVIDAFSSSITGKTIVVTGPSPTSLGAGAIKYLASHPTEKPASIILLGRSLEKTKPLIAKLKELSPATSTVFVDLDLTTMTSVRSAAAAVIALSPKIDIMINNAGVWAIDNFTTTAEGIEANFGINHIGHFLLTNLLLSAKPSVFSAGARIVNIASEGHVFAPVELLTSTPITKESALEAVNFGSKGENYNTWAAYGQSKCANILFTQSLATKLEKRNIQALCLYPGNIRGTGMTGDLSEADVVALLSMFTDVGRKVPILKNIDEGLSTILVAALDKDMAVHSGKYLDDYKIAEPMSFASDYANAEKLWEVSEVLVGETFVF